MHNRLARLIPALLLFSPALAQNAADGLYAPDPPPDSAFVRIINATGTDLTASLGMKKVSASKGSASPYTVIPQGKVAASVGKLSQPLNVKAGTFYSLAITGSAATPKLSLLEDTGNANRAKALIAVYNLSKLPAVEFKTADGKTSVIAGVAPGSTKARAVNGIKADLAVFGPAGLITAFKEIQLERGAAYAVIVSDVGGKPAATWVQSTTAP